MRTAPWTGTSAVLLAVALVAGGLAACSPGRDGASERDASTSAAGPVEFTSPPESPPARRCGSPDLAGPADPPSDAVRVEVTDDLATAVAEAGRGGVLWLEPGTHRLGDGEFSQVVPLPGQTFVGGPGAVLDGGGRNKYAFGGTASDVTISHLTIRGFGASGQNFNEGVVNHDAADDWVVEASTITENAGAGVMLGSGSRLIGNCLADNGQYGFSAYHPDGVRDVVVRENEITGNNTDDWESRYDGCGCTGGGKFWATWDARFLENWVHDNPGVGLWADSNNAGFLVAGNYIADNDAKGLMYETSYNARIVANSFVRNGLVEGPLDPGVPTAAVYLSESGGDERVRSPYRGELLVAHNRFVDNWAGVVAWENADRFAGSPANTSDGMSTLVNPSVATVAACGDPDLIASRPYIDDCRWRTQHVSVTENTFEFDPSAIGASCSADTRCGFVGLFSNWGTYPDWSPYQGEVVERSITFDQDNRWTSNSYVGPWRFMVLEQGNEVDWDSWRSAEFGQDAGSTLSP